ncbi:MAG: 7-carboxy-7-deazaguanine synthase QueE, partial [Candidatus Omnitrophica bacterium]|nr:7-carboxy-7-deazaguanine synthase QueE [Candidatus Omnitrophota bacterium]
MNASIVEIFRSIQGEGKYVGTSQVFVRFGGCNLRCVWCDTPGSVKGSLKSFQELGIEDGIKEVDAL